MIEELIRSTGQQVYHSKLRGKSFMKLSDKKSLLIGTDSAIVKYLDLHRATAENKYFYQGAFSTGVRRVKVRQKRNLSFVVQKYSSCA